MNIRLKMQKCKCWHRSMTWLAWKQHIQIFLSICSSVTTRVTRRCNVIGPYKAPPTLSLLFFFFHSPHTIFSYKQRSLEIKPPLNSKFKKRLNHSSTITNKNDLKPATITRTNPQKQAFPLATAKKNRVSLHPTSKIISIRRPLPLALWKKM